MALSPGARVALEVFHPEYLGDLGQTAVRLARADRVTTVDAVHVERAAQVLITGSGPQYVATVLNSFGSLAAGAGVATVIDFISTSAETTQPVPVTVAGIILSVVGFAMMTVGVVLSVRRISR